MKRRCPSRLWLPLFATLALTACDRQYPSRRDVQTFVELNRLTRTMEAIKIDCDFARESGDRTAVSNAVASALAALHQLDTAAASLRPASGYAPARKDLTLAVHHLAARYGGAPPPGTNTTHDAEFANAYTRLVNTLNSQAPLPRHKVRPTPPPAPVREERDAIDRAIGLAELGCAAEALSELDTLYDATRNATTRHLCLLLTARWYIDFDTASHLGKTDPPPIEQGMDRLQRILDGDTYSPTLYEAFLRWRTARQLYVHGALRSSPIPNAEYNACRDAAIRTVVRYLRRHKRDAGAWRQLRALAVCPNVWRLNEVGNSAFADERRLDPPRIRQRPK